MAVAIHQAAIGERGDGHFQERRPRGPAVLVVVGRALDVLDGGPHHHAPLKERRVVGPKWRRRGQGEIDLGHGSWRSDVLAAPEQRWAQGHRVDQPEGPFGVESRHHDSSCDLLPRDQHHAGGSPAGCQDPGHLRARSHLRPEPPGRLFEGCGKGSRAAPDVRRVSRRAPTGHRTHQEHAGRPRRPRAHGRERDAARGESAPQQLVVQRVTHQIRDRHRNHAERLAQRARPEASQRANEPDPGDRVGERGRLDVRRRGRGDVRQEARHRSNASVERHEAVGIIGRAPPQCVRRPAGVAIQRDPSAVGVEGERHHVGTDEPEPVLREPQVSDDRAPQTLRRVQQRRGSEAGNDLGGPGHAPDLAAPLQDQRRDPGASEIGGTDQPVVAAAHHHHVRPPHLRHSSSVRSPRRRPAGPALP